MRLPEQHPRTFFAELSSSFCRRLQDFAAVRWLDALMARFLYVWLFALSYGMDGVRRQ